MGPRSTGVALAACAALLAAAPATAATRDPINAYRVNAAAPSDLEKLAMAGFDVTEGRRPGSRVVEIYGTRSQISALAREGVRARLVRDKQGRSAAARSVATAAKAHRKARRAGVRARASALPYTGSDAAYDVWRRYDAVPGDGKEQYVELYERLAADSRGIAKLSSIGRTVMGRDIWAVKLTKNAKTTRDNSRPAVLYNAQQHAREWLAGETCRRSALYFADNYGKTETAEQRLVTRLVDTRELWFVCVSNPDGYEYTFTEGNRLWRKNMADNDGDGVRGEAGDGVDPNRNFPVNWGLDDEGSSSDFDSETYRGSSAASEPETKAMIALWNRVDFAFQKNDHTAAELLLYPEGWQLYTPAIDWPIFTALAGDDANSAIADKTVAIDENGHRTQTAIHGNRFDPDVGAELYITNGDTLESAYHDHGVLAFTPEGSEPDDPTVSGFEFQDSEPDVEAEFQRHKHFVLDLAESAGDPARPVSHLGTGVEDFYVDSFAVSYGDPQPVQVLAKKSLGKLELRYSVNGGPVRRASARPWKGGERYYQDPGIYYRYVRGTVRGTRPGDQVKVWFTAKKRSRRAAAPQSEAFTYTAAVESSSDVLVLAAENYTGGVPAQDPNGPHHLSYYTAALDANGIGYDVYDTDARGNAAPDALGVLGHYKAVIWYTGDDILTRRPGQPPATGSARLALDQQVAVRDYLNEGGRLLYTGKNAGQQYADGYEVRNHGFPEPGEAPGGEWCNKNGTDADPATPGFQATPEFDEDDPSQADGCITHSNDFLQYWLGAYVYVSGGNSTDATGALFPMRGEGQPFAGLSWQFGGLDSADNQDHSATFVVTSSILDPQRFPAYADSRSLASWLRDGAAPFSPHSGQYHLSAGADSQAYKRLRRVVDMTGKSSGELSFQLSADLENHWDYLFVEAREAGTENWTTLPERDGLTTQDTGDSCASGWSVGSEALHPHLQHYMTVDPDGSCSPTGTTGAWHAITGSSSGWQEFNADLSQFAGKQVELAITVATDWGTLGLGTWVDDAKVVVDGTPISETSFETDLGGWEVGPPPAGTESPESGWTRATQEFAEGGVVGTRRTIYTGFGFEGIAGAGVRAAWMGGAMRYLGVRAREIDDAERSRLDSQAKAARR